MSRDIKSLFQKAEQGDADAQFTLGINYCLGKGVEEDYDEAAVWYRKAAEQGLADAQFILGLYYEHGIGSSGQDYVEAVNWFRKAAEQGHGTAMNNLALKYLNGDGVQKDIRKYYEWIIKSADSGNQYGLLNLGDIYRDGLKVESGTHQEYTGYHYDFDYEGAHKIKEYTTIVDYETLVDPDIEKAKFYWGESAKRGNKEAKKRLETIY